MNDAFVLKGRLELDSTDFDKGLDDAAEKAKKFGQEGEETGSALKDAFTFSAGQLMADGLREAWDMLKKVTKESVSLASSLTEVQNVVDVTFGDGASEINAWAKSALSAFGMSELKAKKYASTMGAMLKSMGLTDEAAQDMSMSVVSLAADMASFYNMGHEEVMTKIRAGFAGEIEPLRQLGINMSVANLEAYALAQGIDKAYSAMTQAEQATLRYNYLISATADAAGDFSRTSGEYANQVTILSENLNQVKTMFGNALVDILTPQLQEVNKLLTEWIEGDNPVTKQTADVKKNAEEEIAAADEAMSDVTALVAVLEELGDATERTDEEQRIWQKTLEEISRTMPGLAEYIDLANGTLKVSTAELLTNAEAITQWAKAAAEINATQQIRSIWQDAAVAYANTEQQLMFWQAKSKKAGLEFTSAYSELKALFPDATDSYIQDELIGKYNAGYDWVKALDEKNGGAIKKAAELWGAAEEAGQKVVELHEDLAAQAEDLALAKDTYEEWTEINENKNKAQADAMDATKQFSGALEAEQAAMVSVGEAAKKLKEYYDGLKESAHGALDSVVGSLGEMIEYKPADLEKIGEAMDFDNTTLSLYAKNLEAAKNAGMNADMLAFLADGSAENMAILDAWVNGGDEARKLFDEQFKGYTNAKEAAATAMADAQAAVDENYQALEDELEAMVDAFNKADGVTASIDMTEVAIDDGMSAMLTTVQDGVKAINDALAGLPTDVSMNFTVTSNTGGNSGDNPASNAKGLGYVPYDNYLTRLHKGESVLSRVEAENWRKGANNASAGIDYDRLAAVLAANMAGMTMQMDGKMIGALIAPVVSRNIEKEAWRGRY